MSDDDNKPEDGNDHRDEGVTGTGASNIGPNVTVTDDNGVDTEDNGDEGVKKEPKVIATEYSGQLGARDFPVRAIVEDEDGRHTVIPKKDDPLFEKFDTTKKEE